MTREEFRSAAFKAGAPGYLTDPLIDYLFDKVEPAHPHLRTLLANDAMALLAASDAANPIEPRSMARLSAFIRSVAPAQAYGSAGAIDDWLTSPEPFGVNATPPTDEPHQPHEADEAGDADDAGDADKAGEAA